MSQTLAKAAKRKVQKKNTIDPELQQKLVCEEILQKLGTVKDFHKINAVNVYYDKWRVDIWTKTWGEKEVFGPEYHLKHSYFCTVQDNCISNSIPEINEKNR
jgi:hypothetical protein|tara:strand:- start:55 stop:360 length:306 start_codon:yes stop_codon:yes gene_type:complete